LEDKGDEKGDVVLYKSESVVHVAATLVGLSNIPFVVDGIPFFFFFAVVLEDKGDEKGDVIVVLYKSESVVVHVVATLVGLFMIPFVVVDDILFFFFFVVLEDNGDEKGEIIRRPFLKLFTLTLPILLLLLLLPLAVDNSIQFRSSI